MSVTHLGPRFEVHGGGVDLAFPHHESERLQSEGATGQHPVVGHWMHTGMVHYDDAKMSKSLGNLVMVGDLLRDWSADVIRIALLRHRYREDLDWTDARLTDAQATVDRWAAAVATDGVSGWTDADALPPEVEALRTRALEALDEDLDTVRMIAALDAAGRHAVRGRVRGAGRPGAVGARPAPGHRPVTDEPPVPLSVQLGEVVPPEDPEDWRKPLTWIVAVGMLAAPLWAAVWFVLAPPSDPYAVPAGVMALAVMVASRGGGGRRQPARRSAGAARDPRRGAVRRAGGGRGRERARVVDRPGDRGRGRGQRDDRRPSGGGHRWCAVGCPSGATARLPHRGGRSHGADRGRGPAEPLARLSVSAFDRSAAHQDACRLVPRPDRGQGRVHRLASVNRDRAARVEPAARRECGPGRASPRAG